MVDEYQTGVFVYSKIWGLDFASVNRCIWEASICKIKTSADLAGKLHAPEITIHPPREPLCGELLFYRELTHQGLMELLSHAHDKNVDISLEITKGTSKESMTLRRQIQELTHDLCPEFSHTIGVIHCDDTAEVQGFLWELPRILKLHVNNHRGSKYHMLLSDGDFLFPELWPILRDSHLPMMVEGFDRSREYTMLHENMKYIQTTRRGV